MSSLLEDILVCKAYKILTPEKENTKKISVIPIKEEGDKAGKLPILWDRERY